MLELKEEIAHLLKENTKGVILHVPFSIGVDVSYFQDAHESAYPDEDRPSKADTLVFLASLGVKALREKADLLRGVVD